MEIITILIVEGEGVQFNYSGRVTAGMGAAACEAVLNAFREQMVREEVERRVAALTPRPPRPASGRGGDTGEQEN